jgi:1,5-anhydro-D-fructose reductase (1,5-anhydro-D-mannitol-forming)
VHCIDALRFVLGEDVSSVSTVARKDEVSGKVEAIASLQLEMTGGVYANVTASARAPYRTLVEVNGSDGVLIAENGLTVDRPVQLVVRRAGELVEMVTVENGDGYTRMLDGFARAYRDEGNFAATGEDGVINMRALDSAYESWRSGRREAI